MKNLLGLIVIILISNFNAISQSSGVEFILSDEGIETQIVFGGPFYNPLGPTTWSDNEGNILKQCNSVCGLENIKPGRYCVTIGANGMWPGTCEQDFATITKCLDVEGSTCPELTGEMDESDITCTQDDSGKVKWQGQLADCLQGNAKLTWNTDVTNINNQPPITSLSNLTPGKYCVSITPFNNLGQNCECQGYFCTEIGAFEAQPLAIEAEVEPIYICLDKWGNPYRLGEKGSISIYTSGGIGFASLWWTHNVTGDTGLQVPTGNQVNNSYKYCATAEDECGNQVYKCFEIPIIYGYCLEQLPTDDGTGKKIKDITTSPTISLENLSASSELRENQQEQKLENILAINIYPNPTSNVVNIDFEVDFDSLLKYSIYSSLGEKVISSEFEASKGLNQLIIDVSNQSTGLYFLNLENTYSPIVIVAH